MAGGTSFSIMRAPRCHFELRQYELMATKLKRDAIVSINDHPDIRRCFEGFYIGSLAIDYTVIGGANRAERHERIIYSWDREAVPVRRLRQPHGESAWQSFRLAISTCLAQMNRAAVGR